MFIDFNKNNHEPSIVNLEAKSRELELKLNQYKSKHIQRSYPT